MNMATFQIIFFPLLSDHLKHADNKTTCFKNILSIWIIIHYGKIFLKEKTVNFSI